MNKHLTVLQTRHRPGTPAVRSVMPGSVIVPELRYSIPFSPGRNFAGSEKFRDIDFHRTGNRHAMSGQKI